MDDDHEEFNPNYFDLEELDLDELFPEPEPEPEPESEPEPEPDIRINLIFSNDTICHGIISENVFSMNSNVIYYIYWIINNTTCGQNRYNADLQYICNGIYIYNNTIFEDLGSQSLQYDIYVLAHRKRSKLKNIHLTPIQKGIISRKMKKEKRNNSKKFTNSRRRNTNSRNSRKGKIIY
jgi:hypothetical protein